MRDKTLNINGPFLEQCTVYTAVCFTVNVISSLALDFPCPQVEQAVSGLFKKRLDPHSDNCSCTPGLGLVLGLGVRSSSAGGTKQKLGLGDKEMLGRGLRSNLAGMSSADNLLLVPRDG